VITLLCIAIITCTFSVPSNVAKFGIVASGVAVYYYTEYIKPITWVKNICCATLIAASPVVSAFAAFCQILRDSPKTVTVSATSLYPIARMVFSMFSWCMSREIVMDIRDCKFTLEIHFSFFGGEFPHGICSLPFANMYVLI
jgi:4-hydroxybenzoate polyprenyltransferase